jgi:hypothetical protein
MKITKSKLKRIIQEELKSMLLEQSVDVDKAGAKVGDIVAKKAMKKAIKQLQAAKIPQKKNAFTNWLMKYGVKLPVVGRVFKVIFFGNEVKNILRKADAAYVKYGATGVAHVVARSGIGFVPVLGDIANVVDLFKMVAPHWKPGEGDAPGFGDLAESTNNI